MFQLRHSHCSAVFVLIIMSALFACQNNGNLNGNLAAEDAGTSAKPAQEPERPSQELMQPRLRRSFPLSEVAREILREPMRRHARHMRRLLWAAIMLDYPTVEFTAREMLAEPRVSRPTNMVEGLFASSFSPEYIAMETQLYDAAQDLEAAGKAEDPAAMSTAYIKMAGTCMRCHATYLEMPGNEAGTEAGAEPGTEPGTE